MKFDSARYLSWQNQLNSKKLFRIMAVALGIYSVLIFCVLCAYAIGEQPVIAMQVLAALLLARFVAVPLFNRFYKKQRPYQLFGFESNTSKFLSGITDTPDSFPSQHVITLTAISIAMWTFSPVLALSGLLLAALTGIARIILGYHFPSDILAGLVLGIGLGAAAASFTRL